MDFQSVCMGLACPELKLSTSHYPLLSRRPIGRGRTIELVSPSKLCLVSGLKGASKAKGCRLPSLDNGLVIRAFGLGSSPYANSKLSGRWNSGVSGGRANGVVWFGGKSGSVSFFGVTYQSMEELKLVSAPFDEDKGSFLWMLAPAALISSLIVPQFFLSPAIEAFFKDEVLAEIWTSLSFEVVFYAGFAIFLLVTDRIQRPFLEFSPKRWGLITGLRGYLTSVFFTMGLKIMAPLFVVYATWPVLGLPSVVAVAPFLLGCVVQRVFEANLDKCGSSCWPLVPIIFEVYRIYQLTKAAHFIEKLMFLMRRLPESAQAQLLERSNALVAMIVTFQFLGLVCLWSLVTFLLRLFPSRPVAENY